jgi:hypothetical protein
MRHIERMLMIEKNLHHYTQIDFQLNKNRVLTIIIPNITYHVTTKKENK